MMPLSWYTGRKISRNWLPLLVQIIRSQSPTAGVRKKAYQQLVELRFVDLSPRSGDGSGDSRQQQPYEEKPKNIVKLKRVQQLSRNFDD